MPMRLSRTALTTAQTAQRASGGRRSCEVCRGRNHVLGFEVLGREDAEVLAIHYSPCLGLTRGCG